MKVALISESLDISYGGPANSIPNLVKNLKRDVPKIKIFVVKNKNSRLNNPLLSKDYFDYETFDIEFGYGIDYCKSFILELKNFFKGEDNGIIHVNNLWRWAPYKALKMGHMSKFKTVLSARGMLIKAAFNEKKYIKLIAWYLFFQHLLQNVDCIHVTSKDEAIQIRNLGLKTPLAIIPHGMQPYKFISALDKKRAKKKLNLPIDRKYILFLSRISEHKGLDILIKSFLNIAKTHNDYDLLIAGKFSSSSYKSAIKKLITDKELDKRIIFVGEVKETIKEYVFQSSSLFVLPSRSENFGMVVGEALSYGIPVVTTYGTPWSILSKQEIGAWIPRTVSDIERELRHFCSMSDLERNSLQPKIKRLVEKYSWEKSAQATHDLYSWLLGEKGIPDTVIL